MKHTDSRKGGRVRPGGQSRRWAAGAVLLSPVVVAALAPCPARAQFTWEGGGGNSNLTNGANWAGNVAPTPAANANLTFAGTNTLNPNVDVAYAVNSLTFASGAGAFTLSGQPVTLGAGGITQSSANAQAIAANLVATTAQTWSIGAGGLTVSGSLTATSFTTGGAGVLTLIGANSFSGLLTVNGPGIQVGSVAQSATLEAGNVTVNGQLGFANQSTAGGGTITNNLALNFADGSSAGTATLVNAANGTTGFAGSATLGNAALINNGGQVIFGGTSTGGSGGIANNAGTVSFRNNASVGGAVVTNAGSLTFGGQAAAGNASITNTGTINFANSSTVGNAIITNNSAGGGVGFYVSSLASLGTATVVNNGDFFFRANTSAGGASLVNNAGGVADFTGYTGTGGVSLGSLSGTGGTVAMGGFDLTAGARNENTTFAGAITGTGTSLTKVGTGVLTLTGANTYTGNTTVSGGALVVAGAGSLGPLGVNGLVLAGGQFGFQSGSNTLSRNFTLTGAGSGFYVADGGTLTVSGVLSGTTGLTKTGNGTLTLTGANTYTGTTTVQAGALSIRNASAPGNFANISNGSVVNYLNDASAGTSALLNNGSLNFYNTATAAQAGISNNAALSFYDAASAGAAAITNNIGQSIAFRNNATAGTAFLSNNAGATVYWYDNASAGAATLSNQGATFGFLGSATAGSAAVTNNGGTVLFGGTSSAGTASVTNNNGATLTFTGSSSAATATVTNNAGATVNLTDYSGAGGLTIGSLSGAGNVSLGGATLRLGALSGDDLVSGTVGGAAGTLVKVGAGTLTLAGANTYGGGTSVASGVLAAGSDGALGTGTVRLDGGTLQAANGARVLSNAVQFNAASILSTGAVTTTNQKAPGLTLAGTVTLAGDGALSVIGNTRTAITGVVAEDATVRSLVKDGAGTLVLTNDNTYTGGTLIRGGTLIVNNAYQRTAQGSGTGEGAVTVARGGTLSGTYAISGAVQVNSGGSLGVGNSIGQSTVGSLTLAGGSVMQFEIGADGLTSDRLDVSGLLTRSGGGPITFALTGELFADGSLGALSEGTFTLLTFGSSANLGATDFAVTGLAPDWGGSFAWTPAANGQRGALSVIVRQVSVTAAPEPVSVYLLLAAGTPVGLLVRRRKGRGK